MPEVLQLDLVDKDGAIREALDDDLSGTRAEMFKKALAGGGTVLAGGLLIGGLPSVATAKPSAAQDVKIFNFALLLEYLESEFYVRAVDSGVLRGETLTFARTVRDHELAHVAFLQKALGSRARRKPGFDFGNAIANQANFQATAMVLEDTGVAAYNGQGPRLTRRALRAAGQIVSVEARHAAWIRHILGRPSFPKGMASYPAPFAFDKALSRKKVEAAVAKTGFITG